MKYDWWIVSDSFIKRSFAIWWHMMFAYVLTVITVWTIAVVIAVAAWV